MEGVKLKKKWLKKVCMWVFDEIYVNERIVDFGDSSRCFEYDLLYNVSLLKKFSRF